MIIYVLELETVLAPLPSTEKLFSSCLSISSNGKYIAYCSNSTIIIRSLEVKFINKYTSNKCLLELE